MDALRAADYRQNSATGSVPRRRKRGRGHYQRVAVFPERGLGTRLGQDKCLVTKVALRSLPDCVVSATTVQSAPFLASHHPSFLDQTTSMNPAQNHFVTYFSLYCLADNSKLHIQIS
ncbi:hypothetical protein MPLB_1820054 [Mesorhizobium sp. ORS 3324]|nr:hypothetical protein MPLB_1820054 [Mesorhizobium sp. ORS 3324]